MFAYTIRRLLYTFPILLGISLVTFLLFNVFGGDPTLSMLGKHADARSIAELRAQLGLDQPMIIQFLDTVKQMFTFDFGRSYSTKQEISSMMLSTSIVSFTLAAPAFLVTLMMSISISLFVAYWGRSTHMQSFSVPPNLFWATRMYHHFWNFWKNRIDRMVVIICVMGISIPALSYILFGQNVLAYQMDLFPISGYSRHFPDIISYLMLPGIIWVVLSLGGDVRFYRTVILDEVNQDYVRTARAKGVSEKRIFFWHVLKNSLVPIITRVVISIPFLILGSLLLENFFNIPGMGSMMLDAINTTDFPVVRAMVMILSLFYCLFNVLTDLLYAWADPRIQLR